MDRRQFCKTGVLAAAWTLGVRPAWAEPDLIRAAQDALRKSGSNPALAAMAGQPRVMDPYRHYPSKEGVRDPKNGHRFFFHAHREKEYGHFHTFSVDEYGAAVHVGMISVNQQGEPFQLSTTNQWVTGTRYIDANNMVPHIQGFMMDPTCHEKPNLVRFVNAVIGTHRTQLVQLYRERDAWLARYRAASKEDPFADVQHEVLSSIRLEAKS